MQQIKFRLSECLEELQTLLEEDELAGIPLLFFANKQDLIHALEPEEIVEELQLDEIDDRDWSIFGCSAVDGDGLEEGVQWMTEHTKNL